MNNKKTHDSHARELSIHPHRYIKLSDLVISTEEANCIDGTVIKSQPDNLIFDAKEGVLYHIEYKCHDTNSQYHHALQQIEKRNNYLKQAFPNWDIRALYVHDDYKILRIK